MIIETTEQLSYFLKEIDKSDFFINPILRNPNKHPRNNSLSLLYVHCFDSKEDFILVFDHGEKLKDLFDDNILKLINNERKKYTIDKKELYHIFEFDNVIDINLIRYLNNMDIIHKENYKTNSQNFYEQKYYKRDDINFITSIMKHLEHNRIIVKGINSINKNNFIDKEIFKNYNNLVIENLYKIEKNGLFVDFDLFNNYFSDKYLYHNNTKSFLYSNYNIYTSTGRPSNSFKGINFAALQKGNNEREIFKSRFGENGVLIEFDYDSFHIRLLSELIGYKFPEDIHIHEYLGKQYFKKEKLTEKDYEKSKDLSFQQLYGGIKEEYKNIRFFNIIDTYIYNIWNKFKLNGYVESPIFHKKIIGDNFNRQKLLNYIIQCHETEYNMLTLSRLFEKIEKFESRIILYTYDSILFDVNLNDGKEFIKKIKNTIDYNGKFPVKITYGENYNEMKKMEI